MRAAVENGCAVRIAEQAVMPHLKKDSEMPGGDRGRRARAAELPVTVRRGRISRKNRVVEMREFRFDASVGGGTDARAALPAVVGETRRVEMTNAADGDDVFRPRLRARSLVAGVALRIQQTEIVDEKNVVHFR